MRSKNVTMEFHISRESRNKYKFDQTLYALTGNVIFANFHAVRIFAQKMNDKRDLVHYPEQVVRASEINAMGLIDEILHYLLGIYRDEINTDFLKEVLEELDLKFGKKEVDNALFKFIEDFPPVAVYRGDISAEEYFKSSTSGISHRELTLEEMLMLWIANVNPAFSPYSELFDDRALENQSSYKSIILTLRDILDRHPKFGPDNQNLIDMLRSPAIAEPKSLKKQLDYILEKWGYLLGKYLYRLLSSLDFIKEEQKMGFLGPAIAEVYEYGGMEFEPERFSSDLDWMPKVVLLAKNAYVWLDQLSKKYKQNIYRLDQVPDEELDLLASWGFNVLWLIGLWERSKASKRIKQMCGNPDAEASAYSLLSYDIADDLGGNEAFMDLKKRAWRRGIRMSGDMVPNHVGIDANWVVNHPDWFISLDYSPYPSYTFNGPNLSWDERVGIYLEDHYYNRTDAAVVFKRVDHWTGVTKYIYHGNDGTSMPWSDTAQLNYLNPDVREAVIQTILHVARNFPVIRFDAAMTLAKKHFKRLWYPDPGTGGDIPSRAEHSITREDFDAKMPIEFWREVVDRVAKEAPDTLLLAEAFWLLEGYFVRTLGMHRVYNSAFMNMLKLEDNAKYRSVIKNTIEFNPEILKRFVNFMSNPDEETAVAQFGQDDKYFGVCLLMVTMPGLPMFGHGQIEGYHEKYGMEYRRAYWEEQPNEHLIRRHEREIFPLMRKRYLFAEVENFLLYDLFAPEGFVNEDVFAYSNRSGEERSLVVYHNKYANARGWLKTSVGFSVKSGNGEDRHIVQRILGEGLAIKRNENYFTIFRDQITGFEFIRNNAELWDKGLYVELGAFKYQVFLDFREVEDNEWHQYAQLTAYLDGRGVPSVDETLKEIFLEPIHTPFKELLNAKFLKQIIDSRLDKEEKRFDLRLLQETETKFESVLTQIKQLTKGQNTESIISEEILHKLEAMLQMSIIDRRFPDSKSIDYGLAIKELKHIINEDKYIWNKLLCWMFVHSLGKIVNSEEYEQLSRSWIDEWLLGKIMASALKDAGLEENFLWPTVNIIKVLTSHQRWFVTDDATENRPYIVLETLLRDSEVQQFLGINRFQNVLWYNKESFEQLMNWMYLIGVLESTNGEAGKSKKKVIEEIIDKFEIIQELKQADKQAEYQVEKLLGYFEG